MSDLTYLHTFRSTHHVMKAENELKTQGTTSFRLIPTPREISSACGFSLLSDGICKESDGLEHIYIITHKEKGKTYEEIC